MVGSCVKHDFEGTGHGELIGIFKIGFMTVGIH
jgi:hypothetical protein